MLDLLEKYCDENPHRKKSEVVNDALESYLIKSDTESKRKLKVVSLFSGCGGMDLGFRGDFKYLGNVYPNNGFEVIFANDIFKEACMSYENYFNHTPVHQDIKEYLDSGNVIPKCDVVIGGFPCQDFSIAGKRKGLSSERGLLYLQMKRVIEMTQPEIFIAENVKGLTRLGNALDIIKNDFASIEPKYNISHYLLMAADYGVPQTRERVFIVGTRADSNIGFYEPIPTHAADSSDGRKPWVTSYEAIDDLFEYDGRMKDEYYNQTQYSKAKNYGSRLQGNRPIKKDFPGPTIRAQHHGNIEFHYNETRRLTVRECLRIQSFPDDFQLLGSASKAYVQVGNAVPPVLAWHISKQVREYFSKKNRTR
ncbi:DNA cytosine methyltransferase [Peptoclostridium litorale]|uniref:DNA cytosine methyltransferase n=1 Tax=Peptoclostridium litorale TaxID=1557 RepID=UPI001FAB3897|nr:DNA cytosine methyltransferase [Peptoclostridium litorale]